MSSRVSLTIILAVVLMILVMGVAALLTFTGIANRDRWNITETWSHPAASVASMKVTNMTGAGKSDLFVQAGNTVQVLAAGQLVLNRNFPGTLAALMGDVDGDGVQDVIAYYATGEGGAVATAFRATGGDPLWQLNLADMGNVGRAAVAYFDGTSRTGLVAGDMRGKLVAISADGREMWRYDARFGSDLRGLDNVFAGGAHLTAVADTSGKVVVLDSRGQVAWTFNVAGGLRRLRTEELIGPGQSAVLLGGENGTLYVLEGATGKELWRANLGQAVTEIRLAELDANPSTRELVVGGRRNGVWAYSQAGEQLFAASVSGEKTKVNEIAALDVEGEGRAIIAVGDDSGGVTFFTARGSRLASRTYQAPINRVTTGKLADQQQFIVADAVQVRALTLGKQSAPLWYSPLLAGLLACIVIAIAAYVIGSIQPPPPLQLSAEQLTIEAQKARRIMLHESINDLKRMKAAGEVPPETYLARLKDLRAQLADAEANLIKLGAPVQAETITCPNCGGKLELGTDRCEYCGQTVIV